MSTPTGPDPSQSQEVVGNDGWGRVPSAPLGARFDLALDRSQLPFAATAVGVALLSAAVLLSAAYAREKGDLDASTFGVGVAAVVALLLVAAVASRIAADAESRASLYSWPAAAGAVGAGVLTIVGMDSNDASFYVGPVVTIAIAVTGYLTSRGAAFLLAAIAALALLYGKTFDDAIETSSDGENTFMIIGAAVLVFVTVVTVVGWALPDTRVLTGVVTGAGGIAAFAMIFQFLTIARYFNEAFYEDPEFGPGPPTENPYVNDIWAMLGYTALLVLLWTACAIITGHAAFRVLVIAISAFAVPVAAYSLAVSHPTWWEVALVVLGVAKLVGACWLVRRARPAEGVAAQ